MTRVLAILVGVLLATGQAHGSECRWSWVNPVPPRTDLYRVAWAHSLMVAVGAGGTIVTSPDGEHWTPRSSGTVADLYGVEWAGGTWVAVGDGVVVTSGDGRTWTTRWQQPGAVLYDVEYAAARFNAVGHGLDGQILTSTNGSSWSAVDAGWEGGAEAILETDLGLVVSSGVEIWSSQDGSEWVELGEVPQVLSRLSADPSQKRTELAWDGQRLIWLHGIEVYVSEDGTEWQLALEVEEGCPQYAELYGLLGTPGLIVVSGFTACLPYLEPDALLYTSTDGGSSWQLTWDEPGGGYFSLADAPSGVVAVGVSGDVLMSQDGITWGCPGGACTSGAYADVLADVAVAEDLVVAVGGLQRWQLSKRHTGGTVARSTAGLSWEVTAVDAVGLLVGVAWNGSTFVGISEGWAGVSADGLEWQGDEISNVEPLSSVAWGGGRFVAVGDGGAAFESTDGSFWSSIRTSTEVDLERVIFDGAGFVAVGAEGAVVLLDAMPMPEVDRLSGSPRLYGAAVIDGRYVVVGERGALAVSSTGRGFSQRVVRMEDVDFHDIAWNGVNAVAVGEKAGAGDIRGAAVAASPDGDHWTRLAVAGSSLHSVAAVGDGFVAVGPQRTLLHAPCVGPLLRLDPQILRVTVGHSAELVLTLAEPLGEDAVVTVTSSEPGAVGVPSERTLGRYHTVLRIPVEGHAVGDGWVTIRLPAAFGDATTWARVEVDSGVPAPRHPLRRLRH
jgi:hypothetical protein